MPNKTIYIADEKKLYDLLMLLEKRELSFSKWVDIKITETVKAEEQRKQPDKTNWICYHPKIKIAKKVCVLENCPMIDLTYGKVAQERQFAKSGAHCIFRQEL